MPIFRFSCARQPARAGKAEDYRAAPCPLQSPLLSPRAKETGRAVGFLSKTSCGGKRVFIPILALIMYDYCFYSESNIIIIA